MDSNHQRIEARNATFNGVQRALAFEPNHPAVLAAIERQAARRANRGMEINGQLIVLGEGISLQLRECFAGKALKPEPVEQFIATHGETTVESLAEIFCTGAEGVRHAVRRSTLLLLAGKGGILATVKLRALSVP